MLVNDILFIYYICAGIGLGLILFKNNYFYLVLGAEIIINSIGSFVLLSASYFQSPTLFVFLIFLYIVAAYEVAVLFIIFYADRKKHRSITLDYYKEVKDEYV
ncbi:MAG: NADH-quinone oxidoreductase subunit K [Planctomycetota bacterium]